MTKETIKGTIFAVLAAIIFGFTPVGSNLLFSMGSDPVTLTFHRNFLVIPVLLIIMILKKTDFRITKKQVLALIMVGTLFRCFTNIFLYSSYNYIGIGLATTLHFTYPVFTVAGSFLIFGNRMSKTKILALALAMFGIVLAGGSVENSNFLGVGLAIISAITYSGYMIGTEHTEVNNMDVMKVMFYTCIFNSIFLAATDLPKGMINYGLPFKVLFCSFIVAASNSILAYYFLMEAIKRIGAGNVAIYSVLEPLTGILTGIFILGETLTLKAALSCIVIFSAIIIPIFFDFKEDRRRRLERNRIHREKIG